MGQTLSEPITDKKTETDQDERLYWAASGMQGWRMTMEDAHTCLLNIVSSDSKLRGQKVSFFAVFDGHGGHTIAQYAGASLHKRLTSDPAYEEADWKTALKSAFLGIDVDLRQDPNFSRDTSGCTAVAAVITDDWRVFVANAGDSRAVLSANGQVIPLSFDHKPTNQLEMDRISAAGGFVEFGRVNGNLALSRAFGDFDFKRNSNIIAEKQIVTADPDIIDRQLVEDDEFIVLACDGIWDCMSNQEVVNYVRQQIIATNGDLSKISEMIMTKCLAPTCHLGSYGCDNMTVIIVALLRGKTKEEWVAAIAKRVEQFGLVADPEPKSSENATNQDAGGPIILTDSPDGTDTVTKD